MGSIIFDVWPVFMIQQRYMKKQIVLCVFQYLHGEGITHRDLKVPFMVYVVNPGNLIFKTRLVVNCFITAKLALHEFSYAQVQTLLTATYGLQTVF